MNVLLVGLRGSGKTSVGRAVSAAAGLAFVDLDERVLARFAELSVTEIWAVHGEPAWRAGEAAVFAEVLAADGQVVALGGGAPMVDAVHALIETERAQGRAIVVYLRCDPATLRGRMAGGAGDRPSLTGADPRDEIETVLRDRAPRYEAIADFVHEPGDEDLSTTVENVIRTIKHR